MTHLSEIALSRLESAQTTVAGYEALDELAGMLDADGTRSRWDLAGEIARRLVRFDGPAARRILAGHRPPKDRLEVLLSRAVAVPSLPRTQRKIFDLIAAN